ncbi:MAG: 4Fe-4S dicluster domain-containing protein [Deltaproteobacteria bacterium]|nr:MAG: 4Fe-4S dicluster domain-containing protein [Deltaproteobacteria bacterium]
MIYVIAEPCEGVCDTACVDVCPVDCIHGPAPLEEIREVRDKEGEEGLRAKFGEKIQLYIDPEECISCGACEPECPVDAIFEDDELPEKWAHYAESNAKFFEDR